MTGRPKARLPTADRIEISGLAAGVVLLAVGGATILVTRRRVT